MVKSTTTVDSPPRSTWQRLCPLGDWHDPLLVDIERLLDRDEIRAELLACERDRHYPEGVLAALGERGVGRLFAEDATAYHINALNALTARRSGSLAVILGINGLAMLPIYLAATPAQAERAFADMRGGALAAMLLSEWDHGSDLLATSTRAQPGTLEDGAFTAAPAAKDEQPAATHYRLRGEKRLINGATRASLLITLARTADRDDQAERSVFQGAMGLSLFLVRRHAPDTDDTIVPVDRYRTLPVQGADIAGVRFRGTVVSSDALIGKPGEGYALTQRALNLSRGGISAFAVGASNRAVELAAAHARRRELYQQPIIHLDVIADHVARMQALDLAATCLSLKAAAAVNALGQGAAHYTAVAKYACCELAEAVVAEGRRVLGARSLIAGSFEPLMRDVLVFGIFDGTSHIMLEHIQWRLQQMVSRRRAPAAAPAEVPAALLDELAAMYQRPPEPLVEVARRGGRRPFMPHIGHTMAALADIADTPLARSAHELAEVFCDLTGRLVGTPGTPGTDAWRGDQAVRHEAAAQLAYLEAMAATLELAVPAVRAHLGMTPVADTEPWQLAVALLGARVAAQLRHLAWSVGLDEDSRLPAIEADLVRQRQDAARRLRDLVQSTQRKPS